MQTNQTQVRSPPTTSGLETERVDILEGKR